MQATVLDSLDSRDLAIFVVWEPILRPDDEPAARKAVTLLPDDRVHHFWTTTQEVGTHFQPAIGLETEPAWDVYMVYPRGARWLGIPPPAPTTFMHQLGGRLPPDQRLDGTRLADTLRAFLAAH